MDTVTLITPARKCEIVISNLKCFELRENGNSVYFDAAKVSSVYRFWLWTSTFDYHIKYDVPYETVTGVKSQIVQFVLHYRFKGYPRSGDVVRIDLPVAQANRIYWTIVNRLKVIFAGKSDILFTLTGQIKNFAMAIAQGSFDDHLEIETNHIRDFIHISKRAYV